MTDFSQTASLAKEIFEQQLKSAWPWKGAPNIITKHYDAAQSALGNSTARIFLDTDFKSWLGYFIAKQKVTGQLHYRGKAAHQRIITEFEALSIEEQKLVAMELVCVVPHDSMPASEEELREKRRRELLWTTVLYSID